MSEKKISRYVRQEIFEGIGPAGQKKLLQSRVAILGLSGLGTATAERLARAGVGFIRIIDGDFADIVELQRQNIFTESDATGEIPKAAAVKKYLQKVNSEITIEEVISDINSSNIEHFIEDTDLVIDASDSMEIRLLINEACHALQKPWIYGGALAASGMTFSFLPGENEPCLKCFLGDDIYEDGEQPTCATVGVLNPTINMIAALQSAEALKIISGSENVRRDMVMFDLWDNTFDMLPIEKDPECSMCAKGIYEFYGKSRGSQIVGICGKDSVQIIPQIERNIDFEMYAAKLKNQGNVRYNDYTLNFDDGNVEIKLFRNGRAIIKHITDEARAKAVYAEYIGL